MTSLSTLRTFIAIPLPDTILDQLDRVQRRLQRACPDRCIRWVNPHIIHLTLFFIGDMPETRVAHINQALAEISERVSTFTFTVENLGTFPDSRRPNVIWAGVNDRDQKLANLHKAVNDGMAQLGFPPENRKFSPHLTIGRVNRRASRDDRAIIGNEVVRASVGLLGTVDVSEIVFFRSILKHTGAEHIPLKRFRLQNPAPPNSNKP
jgi:2'-5' RNA ligase